MNILFYVEPLIEREQPYWKESWVNHQCFNMMSTLTHSKSAYSFALITNEAIAQTINKNNEFLLATITQEELLAPFGTDYLVASRCWHTNTYTQEQLLHYKNLMQGKLIGFIPDIIISFSPVPFLRDLFASALILHHEYSLFSRLPYPESWFFDPVGVVDYSFFNHFYKELNEHRLSIHQKQRLHDLKNLCKKTLCEKSPFEALFIKLREQFDTLVLLPLQFSGYYLFDDLVSFKTQYEYCVYVLDNTPTSVGVVVNMHPEYPALNDGAIRFLSSKYPHFICFDEFNAIYASGQFILPFVDGVISASSSLALQTLLFDKKFIALGKECFSYIADAKSLNNLETVLKSFNQDKDALLYFLITHYAVTAHYLNNPLWFDNFLTSSLEHFRTFGVDADFYKPIDDEEAVFDSLCSAILENALVVPQYLNMPKIQLFFDFGMGISDKNYLTKFIHTKTGVHTFTFDLTSLSSLCALRLDPSDESCVIDVKSCVLIAEDEVSDILKQFSSNACYLDDNTYYFESNDPQMFFIPENSMLLQVAQKLVITIEYLYTGDEALEFIIKRQIEEIKAIQLALSEQEKISMEFKTLFADSQNKYTELLQSKSWKLTAPLRTITAFTKKIFQR